MSLKRLLPLFGDICILGLPFTIREIIFRASVQLVILNVQNIRATGVFAVAAAPGVGMDYAVRADSDDTFSISLRRGH